MDRKTERTVYMTATKENVEMLEKTCQACAGPKPCISGMRKHFWGKDAYVVRCGAYAYLME